MNKEITKNDSKSGQQKFYGLMLILIFIILALLYKFYPSSNFERMNSDLQPIRDISSATGLSIWVYAGTISKISTKSITLSNGDKSKVFIISEQHPARFVKANGEPIEPKIGSKAALLFLVELPSKEKYVTKVVINTSSRK